MIIGTAGHVDHGKTALVRALTGVDGDRLKEEKARGITIDLGFAYTSLAGGGSLGFVDVPGHERFVRTMLAGASGIDFVLLLVAADDGIKPQTLEHLAIIDLLGIGQGLVVMSKTDLVGPERRTALTSQLRAALAGTTLEPAEILPVSVETGEGLETLRSLLAAAAAKLVRRSAQQRFRLAVDRVFTLSGAGLVVTGTILSGAVAVGDRLSISPSGLEARVRSLHAQNRPAERSVAGERCALNLAGDGVTKEALARGDMVVDPALHAPTARIDARLRLLPGEVKPISQWFAVRLHHAAVEVGARVVLLEDAPLAPGHQADVQLVLDRPIAAASQDRFVLRDVSAQRTIGGGCFIDLRAPSRRRRGAARAAQRAALALTDPHGAFLALLDSAPFVVDVEGFARDRALSPDQTEALLALSQAVSLVSGAGRLAMSAARWQAFARSVTEHLAAFHDDHPDLQGVGREKLRLGLRPLLPAPQFRVALAKMHAEHRVALDGAFVRLVSHTARLTAADQAAWAAIAPMLAGNERFRPQRVRDIASALARPEGDIRRLLKLAGKMGWADEIAHDHFFLRSTVQEMLAVLVSLAAEAEGGQVSAAQLRDRLDNGRKVAIQICEFFDRHGVTLRQGDLRRVNKHRLDLFGGLVHLSDDGDGGESSPVGRSDFKSEWGSEPVPGGFDSRSPPPILPRTRC